MKLTEFADETEVTNKTLPFEKNTVYRVSVDNISHLTYLKRFVNGGESYVTCVEYLSSDQWEIKKEVYTIEQVFVLLAEGLIMESETRNSLDASDKPVKTRFKLKQGALLHWDNFEQRWVPGNLYEADINGIWTKWKS